MVVKVILSRKGVDSGNSQMSNLVVKNGDKTEIVMIPIPSDIDKVPYKELSFSQDDKINSYTKGYIESKTKKQHGLDTICHADPNLRNFFGDPKFLGSIGQVGASLSHLRNQDIKEKDIFIFFG